MGRPSIWVPICCGGDRLLRADRYRASTFARPDTSIIAGKVGDFAVDRRGMACRVAEVPAARCRGGFPWRRLPDHVLELTRLSVRSARLVTPVPAAVAEGQGRRRLAALRERQDRRASACRPEGSRSVPSPVGERRCLPTEGERQSLEA